MPRHESGTKRPDSWSRRGHVPRRSVFFGGRDSIWFAAAQQCCLFRVGSDCSGSRIGKGSAELFSVSRSAGMRCQDQRRQAADRVSHRKTVEPRLRRAMTALVGAWLCRAMIAQPSCATRFSRWLRSSNPVLPRWKPGMDLFSAAQSGRRAPRPLRGLIEPYFVPARHRLDRRGQSFPRGGVSCQTAVRRVAYAVMRMIAVKPAA